MYRVLIVEDELILRNGIVSLIDWRALDCEVAGECRSGREAAEFLMGHVVDIVVTDILMPGMSGLELLSEIRARHPHIATVILTAYANFAYAQEALKLGAWDYVVKANFVAELPKAIARVVAHLSAHPAPSEDEMRTLILRSILRRELTDEQRIRQWREAFSIHLEGYHIVLMEARDLQDDRREAVLRFYRRAFAGRECDLFWYGDRLLLALVNVAGDTRDEGARAVAAICEELHATSRFIPLNLALGISRRHATSAELTCAFDEAMADLRRNEAPKRPMPEHEAEALPAEDGNELADFVDEYLQAHYRETIKLIDLAETLHVHISHLSRLYKRARGDSIINRLNALRVEKAKSLLIDSDYPISRIGNLVGIDDPAYFSSVFSKYTGLSPKKYRRRAKVSGKSTL